MWFAQGREPLIAAVSPEGISEVLGSDSPAPANSAPRYGLSQWAPTLIRVVAYSCPLVAYLCMQCGFALSGVAFLAVGSLGAVFFFCRVSRVEEIAIIVIICYCLVLLLSPALLVD